MKKSILALATLPVLLLGACSDDEPVNILQDEPHEAISFRPSMAGVSRATEVTNANLPSVTVTALLNGQNYFTNLLFSKDNTGFFNSTKPYYWPGDNSSIDFYAYYPDMDTMGADVTVDNTTKEITNFTVAEQIADQVDLITAHATGNQKANEASGVPLEFKHRLAQIEIRAKSSNPSYKVTVVGARIGRAQTTGTFNMADSSWTMDEWHDTNVWDAVCDPVELTPDPVSVMGEAGNAMMIPQTLYVWNPTGDPDNAARMAYLAVRVRIVSDTGVQLYPFPGEDEHTAQLYHHTDGYAWTAVPLSTTWEQGKKYIYNLDFTNGGGYVDPDDPTPGKPVIGGSIKVVPEVTEWSESDIDVPMTTTTTK